MLKKYTFTFCLLFATISVAIGQNVNKQADKYVVPQSIEQLYDDLFIKWKKDLKYSDDCYSTSDAVVTVPDSVYIHRLHSLPTEMELAFNPMVKSCIELYAGRRKNQVSYLLGEGEYFYPMFENILDREGVPLELKYLPVIESALNPIARSRVGASGLWQFMAGTGKLYKLEINSLVDERLDPVKSTEAAARYLKDMYGIYGDWNLVIAAYNCGPGNVNKAIRRSGGKKDYWAIYPYLPRETRGYVPMFIAATYIMNYYEEHNICPGTSRRSMTIDTLKVTNNIHFGQIAGVLDIDIDDIRRYNPEFKADIIPGEFKPYTLNLPFHKVASYIEKEDSILAYRKEEFLTHRKSVDMSAYLGDATGGDLVHRVKTGDTLSGIAKKYGVSVSQLRSWNNLRNDRLTIGRRLSIFKKVKRPAVKLSSTPKADEKKDEVVTTLSHLVEKGETWSSIASKYKVEEANLKAWNKNYSKKGLVVGKNLIVLQPKAKDEKKILELVKPQLMEVKMDFDYISRLVDHYLDKMEREEDSCPRLSIAGSEKPNRVTGDDSKIIYHKVKAGETLLHIANRYKVTKENIVEWNNLLNTSPRVGQRLIIHLSAKGLKMVQSEHQKGRNKYSSYNY